LIRFKAINSDLSAVGLASSIVDNVPLVAATMAMYPTSQVLPDSQLWQLIAYCAGTGTMVSIAFFVVIGSRIDNGYNLKVDLCW
jgi:Na+/H+ antiporter NhaD/arsenite permease-like protein